MGRKNRNTDKKGRVGPDGLSKYGRKLAERALQPSAPVVAHIPSDSEDLLATIPNHYLSNHWYTLPVTEDGETLFLHLDAMNGVWGQMKGGSKVVCTVGRKSPYPKKYRPVLKVSFPPKSV